MNPEKIGRYEIKSELGRGGMATVYEASDPVFERTVAVKVLPREFMHDPEFRARFVREARTIAALEHPAIVPVYDFGEDGGQPYLVMRLMPGGSLADKLKQGPFSIAETATILRRLGSALNRAHGQGIVHRDLKPSNILFDQYGNAFLTDFGIVHVVSSSSALTASGSLVGTPSYMSPEQVYGDKALDGRSDIYALGIILFQMLTGHLPYEADTPARVMMKHVMDPVPEILKVRPDLPPACNDIITKAMAKKPDERFPTASDLSEALASLATRKTEQPDVAEKLAGVRSQPTAQWDMAVEPAITPPPPPEPPSPPDDTATPAAGLRAIPIWVWSALAALALVCLATLGVASWLLSSSGFAFLAGTATPTIAPLSSPTAAVFVAAATAVPAEAGGEEPASTEPAAATNTPAGPTLTPNLAKTRESAVATRNALTSTPATDVNAGLAATRESAAATRAALAETVVTNVPAIPPAFGPQDGRLDHDLDDTIENAYSGVNLQNFVAEATLGNPYAVTTAGWDFGLLFRQAEVDEEFRLVVESNGDWTLNDRRGREDNFVQEGRAKEALRLLQGGQNTIRLIAWHDTGYFFLNDNFIAALDLSARSDFGDIALGTGFYADNERAGASTPYQGFAVWPLAPQFGPRSGRLEHVDDNLVKSRNAGVELVNLMAQATFTNPYAAATGGWDVGFAFRQTSVANQLWLIVTSEGDWSLLNRVDDEDNYLDEGTVSNLDVTEGGQNHLTLIAQGNSGYFFLNDSYVATLNLSDRLDIGDVEVVTAFFVGNELPGNATGYENFTVWPLP